MRTRERYYIDAYGADDPAMTALVQKAIEIEHRLGNITRIVFVADGLQNTGWMERQYGHDGVKQLKKGARLPGSNITAKFESVNNYDPIDGEIVITLGLRSKDILKLDDNFNIAAVLALPWAHDDVEEWARLTGAINIQSGVPAAAFEPLPCVVTKALDDLSFSINMSTGILHSSDNDLAKTYLRALSKYGYELNALSIEAYLINQKAWSKSHADDFIVIVNKINTGKSFHGGDKTYLKYHIDRWKKDCGE